MVFEIDKEALRKGWSNKFTSWFNPETYLLQSVDTLGEFDTGEETGTAAAQLIAKGYIPYFTITEEEVVRSFIAQLGNKKLSAIFANTPQGELRETFWKYFNAYKEISEQYEAFEDAYLRGKARAWCEENAVSYAFAPENDTAAV